ncbi:MAG: SpoIIE family protein phosphatase [Gemmataceae bacterium]
MSTGPAAILVSAAQVNQLRELRHLLELNDCAVTGHLLGSPDPDGLTGLRAIVLDGSGQAAAALELCGRLRARLEDHFVPILFVTDDHTPAARLASFEAGADTYLLRPFVPAELVAQMAALLRIKEIHDRLAERTAEIHRINRRLHQAYQQIDEELELAQRIQASFLPQTLPQVPNVRFAVQYMLCGRVGGDFYDIFRLDEEHVGFYVADAMGHGVPASLLTIFVKKGVRPKEVNGNSYRLVPPDEVLGRLNRDLIDQELSGQPFITLAYALFNHKTGALALARAGHPYPLHVPRTEPVQLWKQEGFLLGVVDARFPLVTRTLGPGDKLLLYTDGIDHARFEDQPPGLDSLIGCADRHRGLPAREFVDRLARDLFGTASLPDDLTLLALERCE